MGMQPIWSTKQNKFPLLGIEIYSHIKISCCSVPRLAAFPRTCKRSILLILLSGAELTEHYSVHFGIRIGPKRTQLPPIPCVLIPEYSQTNAPSDSLSIHLHLHFIESVKSRDIAPAILCWPLWNLYLCRNEILRVWVKIDDSDRSW